MIPGSDFGPGVATFGVLDIIVPDPGGLTITHVGTYEDAPGTLAGFGDVDFTVTENLPVGKLIVVGGHHANENILLRVLVDGVEATTLASGVKAKAIVIASAYDISTPGNYDITIASDEVGNEKYMSIYVVTGATTVTASLTLPFTSTNGLIAMFQSVGQPAMTPNSTGTITKNAEMDIRNDRWVTSFSGVGAMTLTNPGFPGNFDHVMVDIE